MLPFGMQFKWLINKAGSIFKFSISAYRSNTASIVISCSALEESLSARTDGFISQCLGLIIFFFGIIEYNSAQNRFSAWAPHSAIWVKPPYITKQTNDSYKALKINTFASSFQKVNYHAAIGELLLHES